MEEARTLLPTAETVAAWDFNTTERTEAICVFDEGTSLSHDDEDNGGEFKLSRESTESPVSDYTRDVRFEQRRLRHERQL
jgi:hypothetical protein